jgi:hypothetical protein
MAASLLGIVRRVYFPPVDTCLRFLQSALTRSAGFRAVLRAGFRAVRSAGFIAKAVAAFVAEGAVVLRDLVVGLAAEVALVSDFF